MAAASFWFGTPAQAATVRVVVTTTPGYKGDEITEDAVVFTASRRERNTVTAANTGAGIRIEDSTAAISAGAGCVQDGPNRVHCRTAISELNAVIDAGDGDDVLRDATADDAPVRARHTIVLRGEAGNDTLVAGAGGSTLDGGPGDDTLHGGPDSDTLTGGGGSDALDGAAGDDRLMGDTVGAAPAADRIDGGPGSDTADYSDHSARVNVDLRRSSGNGTAGEGDTLRGVENVTGGRGSDRLVGDSGANTLTGGGAPARGAASRAVLIGLGGDDRLLAGDGTAGNLLDGGAGNDVVDDSRAKGAGRLTGGSGNDSLLAAAGGDALTGGPGNDELTYGNELDDAPYPPADCGPGRDRVHEPGLHHVLGANCEEATLQNGWVLLGVRRQGRRGFVARFMAYPLRGGPCRETLSLLVARRGAHAVVLARSVIRPRPEHFMVVHMPAAAAGRRLLAARRPLTMLVRIASDPRCDARATGGSDGVHGFITHVP